MRITKYKNLPQYCGYCNQMTFIMWLHLSQEKSEYDYWVAIAAEYLRAADTQALATYGVMEEMEKFMEDKAPFENPHHKNTIWDELSRVSFAYVNWREIAQYFIGRAKELQDDKSGA